MRNLLGALAFTAAFVWAQHASALIITATLDSFESTPQTVAGVGTGGGRGTFTLTGSDVPISAPLASILDDSFQAVCLEPEQFVTVGQSYQFRVTDLAFAPTSPNSTGGMGAVREALVENALGRQGVTTVEAMSLAGVAAATALVYEAGYESAVNSLDLTAGTAVVTGSGAVPAQNSLSGALVTNVDAYALINIGPGGFGTRSVWEAQDFFVTVAETVPSPGPLALMGLGLLGLMRLRGQAA